MMEKNGTSHRHHLISICTIRENTQTLGMNYHSIGSGVLRVSNTYAQCTRRPEFRLISEYIICHCRCKHRKRCKDIFFVRFNSKIAARKTQRTLKCVNTRINNHSVAPHTTNTRKKYNKLLFFRLRLLRLVLFVLTRVMANNFEQNKMKNGDENEIIIIFSLYASQKQSSLKLQSDRVGTCANAVCYFHSIPSDKVFLPI